MSHLGTRSLTVTVDGVTRTGDVSACRIISTPKPDSTRGLTEFAVADYSLQATIAQDPAVGSLWDLVWSNAGTWVEIEIRPAGGVDASPEQPRFTGEVLITAVDGVILGGDADRSPSNRFTFDVDWPFRTKPTRWYLDG